MKVSEPAILIRINIIESWYPAETLPYQTRNDVHISDRWEFNGKLAPEDIRGKYINETVKEYFSNHARNSITYVNC